VQNSDHTLVSFEAGGLSWVADAAFESTLREKVAPHLDSLEDAGGEQIKRSLSRSVHRLTTGGRTVYIKHHRPKSLLEQLKYLVLKSRAEAEWNAAMTMAGHGIPVARPLAFGERRTAGFLVQAVLVSEAVENAVELGPALGGEGKDDLVDRAAQFIRRTHDSHILHRDLHGGNILVRDNELFFIDVHRVTINRAVSRRDRAWNLGQLFAFLGDRLDEADHARFIAAYVGPDGDMKGLDAEVRRHLAAVRERRYASRAKRCVKKSTGFRRERMGGMTVLRRTDFPPELITQAIDRHNAAEGDSVLKSDRRSRVTCVEVDGPMRVCVKEFTRPGPLQRLADAVLGSRARQAWLGAHALLVRGIPTPRPCAMAEAGPRSFLITEYLEDAQQLIEYVSDHCRPDGLDELRTWRRHIRDAADFLHLVHSHRVRHRDLGSANVLVRERDGGLECYLIDVSDVKRGRAPSRGYCAMNLGQIGDAYRVPSRTDRLRFVLRYAPDIPRNERRALIRSAEAVRIARHDRWLVRGDPRLLAKYTPGDDTE
jgi:tRNA A-37 threonylcarbamoyl transferase component Bud32